MLKKGIKSIRAINFCPSCAPCINEVSIQDSICNFPYGNFAFFRHLHVQKETAYDKTHDKIIKAITSKNADMSAALFTARDAPQTADSMAWLSLDGMAKYQHAIPKTTTVINEAQFAAEEYLPNPARAETLSETAEFTADIKKTPQKLNTADKRHARFIDKTPVHTEEAMAPGASVQPFTNTTPMASKSVKMSAGVYEKQKISVFIASFFH